MLCTIVHTNINILICLLRLPAVETCSEHNSHTFSSLRFAIGIILIPSLVLYALIFFEYVSLRGMMISSLYSSLVSSLSLYIECSQFSGDDGISSLTSSSSFEVLGLAFSLLSPDSLTAACSLSTKADLKPLVLRPLAISAYFSSLTFHC